MDLCYECAHPDAGETDWLQRLWSRLTGRPAEPACPAAQTSAESGVGLPGPCGCTAPFHA